MSLYYLAVCELCVERLQTLLLNHALAVHGMLEASAIFISQLQLLLECFENNAEAVPLAKKASCSNHLE